MVMRLGAGPCRKAGEGIRTLDIHVGNEPVQGDCTQPGAFLASTEASSPHFVTFTPPRQELEQLMQLLAAWPIVHAAKRAAILALLD